MYTVLTPGAGIPIARTNESCLILVAAQLGGPVATADLFAYQILCTKWRMYNYA